MYAEGTPWKLTAHLREQPLPGQIFNPDWWGDWLTWDGPRGLEAFITGNVHLLPRQIFQDYRIVRETRSGWQNVLERYDVRLIVLDKRRQTTLLRFLRASREWRIQYEDDLGAVIVRV